MKYLWLMILAGLSLTGLLSAGEPAEDYSGTWVLDPDDVQVDLTTPGIRKLGITINRNPTSTDTNDPEVPPETPPAAQIRNLTMQIVQTDGQIQVARQFVSAGREQTVTQKFTFDGAQCFNLASDGRGGFVSRTSWKKKKLVHSGTLTLTIHGRSTEVYVTEEYSLSKKGKKLTIKTMSTTPQGTATVKQAFKKEEKSKP